MEKATIYDYARMCNSYDVCNECPLDYRNCGIGKDCDAIITDEPDIANEIILNWCKEHPVETRQNRFLKMFPNANILCETVDICPRKIDKTTICDVRKIPCPECQREYWLAEVDENDK